MDERRIPQELDRLVEGELGKAVLEGFALLVLAALGDIIKAGEYDRLKHIMAVARRNAADVVIPDTIVPEMREAYRETIAQAVEFAFNYQPDFGQD